jgi:DNA-binding MarR family transcriptional regulator
MSNKKKKQERLMKSIEFILDLLQNNKREDISALQIAGRNKGLSRHNIKTAISWLKETGLIETSPTNSDEKPWVVLTEQGSESAESDPLISGSRSMHEAYERMKNEGKTERL